MFARFAGTWKITYSNGMKQTYVITAAGMVRGTNADGNPLPAVKLIIKGSDVLLIFNPGIIEHLKVSEKTLLVEHFSLGTLYPASLANYHATGTLVSILRE